MGRYQREVCRFGGACAFRLTDSGGTRIPEHKHDFPVLSLFVIGGYTNLSEAGLQTVDAPSAMFYQAGEAHSNQVSRFGLEQVDVEFDPGWLGLQELRTLPPVKNWVGGPVAARARLLARLWSSRTASEAQLKQATLAFLRFAHAAPEVQRPTWVSTVDDMISSDPLLTTDIIAGRLALHPGWLAQAYRSVTAEGIRERMTRRKVELAATYLASCDKPLAFVAADAGFCDQSHMNRCFGRFLGRSPTSVRHDFLRTVEGIDRQPRISSVA